MPYLIVWLVGALGPMLLSVAGRVLLALGIGVITYAGVDTALTAMKTAAFANLDGLPATVLAVLFQTKVDQAMNVIISALIGSVAMQGVSGAITKFSRKAPV